MVETSEIYASRATEILRPLQRRPDGLEVQGQRNSPAGARWFGQVMRFGTVGILNTLVDLMILNGLLWLSPTTSVSRLLAYNVCAYSLGAINSFILNKYWTFGQRQKTTSRELLRFTLTTLFGIGWSSLILWLAGAVLHPLAINVTVWANLSKGVAIVGGAILSYLAMRLWVFVRRPVSDEAALERCFQENADSQTGQTPVPSTPEARIEHAALPNSGNARIGHAYIPSAKKARIEHVRVPMTDRPTGDDESTRITHHSLSVVLPVYNEEEVIASTIEALLETLHTTFSDLEIIPVNDGSHDRSAAILANLAAEHSEIRVVTHTRNQGYGATLADGFAAARKELTLFMDSDGQFDSRDLPRLLTFIDEYDAVLGYRLHRQDNWMRKLNAWGWKTLVWLLLEVRVRDIDCAFKLLRTDFLQHYAPETRGAMINAELLYNLKHSGSTYREVGVRHLPRQGGRATGANPRVIARAFGELFSYAWQERVMGHLKISRLQLSRR